MPKVEDSWTTELREHLQTRFGHFPEGRFDKIFGEIITIITRERTVNISTSDRPSDWQQMLGSVKVFLRQHPQPGIY
ncbi:MAG: hypothetical protein COV91_01955 [Candidatus Taylorbacteria bacterium CG11_big_fil_rev_8_21_14_0_20_46_11]|uniref:Uncharacterized protein n=1 Tax=Candidatus Taylorbacteria bacterium CG11_big_fil_rev_8_21_14_0_20_46_11 TaxID=1975025 RepID=A0A2H0KC32_9BACT|nr:MAG: hypothetical protein COV91_01955 [Candidatus Taylorbacteria bacterium CG11_big_fil_rev_8_21_14_0_20_46_11]